MRIFATMISLLMCLAMAPRSVGEVVYLCSTAPTSGGVMEAKGSAVCVGRTGGKSILLTAKHNLEGMYKVWVQSESDWVECRFVAAHPSEDVALLETSTRFKISPLAVAPDSELKVTLEGVGPHVHDQRQRPSFQGRVRGELMVGLKGEHAIPGDSGGPVYCDGAVVGIVSSVRLPSDRSPMPTSRLQYRGTTTRIVRTKTVLKWIQTQYQCGPQGCPIILRPAIRQPMAGLTIPIGPPQIVHEAVPAPRRYVPEPMPDELFTPSDEPEEEPKTEPRIVQGPRGPAGKDGRDGRAPTEAEIRKAVNEWLDENSDSLRGKDGQDGRSPSIQEVASVVKAMIDRDPSKFRGPAGEPGVPGPKGERGPVGVPDEPDMKAVVRGWLADPETRTWLVDELSQDMRIQDLIERLEAVEARGATSDSGSAGPRGGTVVAKFVLVKAGSNARVETAVANAKKQWDDIIEVSKEQIPRNVVVKTYPTLIAFSPDGDVAGMWESEYSVLNTLARISSGQYP